MEEEKNPVECDFHEDKKKWHCKKFDEQTFIFSPYKALCIFFVSLFLSKELLLLSASIQA